MAFEIAAANVCQVRWTTEQWQGVQRR